MAEPTLSDIVLLNDENLKDSGFSEILDGAPLIAVLAAVESTNGNVHKYLRLIANPTVGFIDAVTGRAHSKAGYEEVTDTLKTLDASFSSVKAIAMAYVKGASAFVERELKQHLRAYLVAFEKQLLNGQAEGDSAGFVGLADTLNYLGIPMVVDGGGTTADKQSSCYFIRNNTEDGVAPSAHPRIDVGETTEQKIADGSDGWIPGLYTPVLGWLGVQLGSSLAAGRIANLNDADDSKGLNDTLLSKMLEAFPSDKPPTHIVMNRKQLGALQRSRTATNPTGAEAPRPTHYEMIPIVVTDSLKSTEAVVAVEE